MTLAAVLTLLGGIVIGEFVRARRVIKQAEDFQRTCQLRTATLLPFDLFWDEP